jgi:ATP-dependent protease ClpP protease subunit
MTPPNPTNNQPPLPNVPTGTFYVNFFDEINDQTVRGLMALCSDIIGKAKPAALYFGFSSPGGSVAAGITLYNFLKGLPVELIMHNTGSVDSIATAIFLAAGKRYACPHSKFLFHGVGMGFPRDSRFNRSQLREYLSGLENDETRIRELVVERTKLSGSELIDLFTQGEAKDTTYALEKGVISEIKPFEIPTGTPFITANFSKG